MPADPDKFREETPDTRHGGQAFGPAPLSVLTTTPVRNGPQVSRSAWIDVIFNQPITIQSLVTPGAFTVVGSVSGSHPGVAVQGATGRDIRYFPDTPFAIGETVTVSLSSAVTATMGGTLSPYSFQFFVQSVVNVPVVGHTGNTSAGEVWAAGSVHLITGDVTVPVGRTLTIEPGAIVKLAAQTSGSRRVLLVNGSLVASGTAAAPIVFTSSRDDLYGGDSNSDGTATSGQPGDWGTLRYAASSVINYALSNSVFRFGGGNSSEGHEVRVTGSASLTVTGCTFEGSAADGMRIDSASANLAVNSSVFFRCQYGLYATAFATGTFSNSVFTLCNLPISQAGTAPVYTSNIFTGNVYQAIAVGETLTQNVLWQNLGIAYLVDRDLTVPASRTLTVEAGVVVKFQAVSGNVYRRQFDILGGFVMQSTAANPIVFTSSQDDEFAGDTNGDGTGSSGEAGHWSFIRVRGSANIVFHDAIVKYGGRYRYSDCCGWYDNLDASSSLWVSESATLRVTGVVIGNAWRTALRGDSNNATLIVQGCTLQNSNFGLYCTALALGSIENSTFRQNVYPVCQAGTELFYIGNTFQNNTWQVIAVEGTLTRDVVWDDVQFLGLPYLVIGDVTVPTQYRLFIDAGIVVKFAAVSGNAYRRLLDVVGGLELRSTPTSRVVFTSSADDSFGGDTNRDGSASAPSPGDWAFIRVRGSAVVSFHDALVRYGARYRYSDCCGWYDNLIASSSLWASENGILLVRQSTVEYSWRSAVTCDSTSATLVVDSCVLSDNAFGVYCSATAGATLQSNTITRNTYPVCQAGTDMVYLGNSIVGNTWQVIAVEGTHNRNVVWDDVQGLHMPYYVIGNVSVPVGLRLSIDGGVVVKFDAIQGNAYRRYIDIFGVLETRASVCAPVVFTSIRDDQYGGDTNRDGAASAPAPGDWSFIRFRGSGISDVHDVVIRFGGHYRYSDCCGWYDDLAASSEVMVQENATLTLRDAVLEQSWYRAILFDSATAAMSVDRASLTLGRVAPNNLGLTNTTSRGVTATNVWWGDASGPSGVGPGSGASVTANVVYSPWRTRPGFLAAGVDSTGGDALGTIPPAGTVLSGWESNTFIRAFNERLGVSLSASLTVEASDVGTVNQGGQIVATTIPAGTFVNSHLLHLNSVGTASVRRQGTVTFDTTILGVIVTANGLNSTDAMLGSPGVVYPTNVAGRGVELDAPIPNDDEFEIMADRRTIRFLGSVSSDVDEVRVITAAATDCNANGRPDACDISEGRSEDLNSDGIPDECQVTCYADFNQDGGIDGADVDEFFAAWETGDVRADVNLDGGVDGDDVSVFFAAWSLGSCE
ncbi:MAG: right-handed parallel beta-helix repeat-containing protein [Planctomycetes bacterium]|nr:right-handed parallel beta-helix repeat-containing protein [Planctomycetota bacterium]